MNVLLLFSSKGIGGAERSLTRMSLYKCGINYHYGTIGGKGEFSEWLKELGILLNVFGGHESFNLLKACLLTRRYVFNNNIDIIYICGLRAMIILRILFITMDIKIIHGVRWNPNTNSKLDKLFRFSEYTFKYFTNAWITNSLSARNTIIAKLKLQEKKVINIYNGIDIPSVFTNKNINTHINVLTVANINHRKGYIEYLNSIERVIKVNQNFRFHFVGRDDLNGELQHYLKIKKLEDYVEIMGYISDLKNIYCKSSIFVLPSIWGEGCPTSILEAMSYKLPIVAFDIDGISELVENNKNGFLVDKGDYKALAEKILELKEYNFRNYLGSNGFSKVYNEFTLVQSALSHYRAFKQILNN